MKSKKLIWIVVLILAIIGSSFFFVHKNGDYETYTVEKNGYLEVVEMSGKVVPAQEINLSFEVVGRVSRINVDTGDFVKAGQVLVELDSSEVVGELNEVLSNLEKERALLSEVTGDSTAQNRLQNESQNLISTIEKAYVTSDDIVKNTVDLFIENPNGLYPQFTNALRDYFLRREINDKREFVGNMLDDWKEKLDTLSTDNLGNQDVQETINNLTEVENLLKIISSDIDQYDPTNNITQTQINNYITSISNARGTVSSLIVEINSTFDQYRDVLADIPVIESTISGAEASVQKLAARRDKYVLTAPFDGVITDKDIERGQVVSAGESVFSMISNNAFEVEAFVPELNIIRVDVGDNAELQFDAFGDNRIFEAVVSHVDPRETIKDGITTYKITLDFKQTDPEIRSGMTNDISIAKDYLDNQIVIPRYLISSDEGGEYVYILENGKKIKRYIETGRKDGRGGIIVESGLNEGDQIIVEK